MQIKETKISIINKYGERLVGLETLPSTEKEKYPTILLVHGFGVTKEEAGNFNKLTQCLTTASSLVYRFDLSGCGESEGDYSQTSLSKLRSDLSDILDFVKSQAKVDESRIGILGQSFGTSVTIALEPKVKSLVMTSSISHPKVILTKLFGTGYNPHGTSSVKRSDGTITKIGPQFWPDFDNYDLLESIKKIHCPVLFIHGSQDKKVPISEAGAYFQSADEPKEKIVIEGMEHGWKPYRERVYKLAVDWFKKHLA
ncbi:alpha/beta fold hydrolase [Candidatus Parcubacteria bacterium]|nr:alpha/beta fold hydrolase [Candidatus Parcubacteria bacterium]